MDFESQSLWKIKYRPVSGIDRDCSGTFDVAGDQRFAETSVQFGHFDLVEIAFDPIQIFADPIHGQTFGGWKPGLHHHFYIRQSWNHTF